MAEMFKAAELVKIAIEDEKTGVAFYSKLAENSENLAEIFADLAEQEKFHQARFEEMLATLGGQDSPEQYPSEYNNYLQTLTKTRAFPDENTAVEMAANCTDDGQAIELASRFERDTLLLMGEMACLVGPKHKEIVDELIKEEQSHLVTLADASENIT